jgi:uncharacterized protein
MAQAATREAKRQRTQTPFVDCDIHPAPASHDTILTYLPERWHHRFQVYGPEVYPGAIYPRNNPQAARTDAWPPSGLPPGADLSFMREQLLDEWNVEFGILDPLFPIHSPNVEYSAALASAVNDWQLAEWLEPEPRLRGSITVPYEDGDLAA